MKRDFIIGFCCGLAALTAAYLTLPVYLTAQPAQAPSQITGCIYESAAITLTNRQSTALLCDINGRLKVTTTP